MKVAIIQNKIGVGGRNVVISEFIKICNINDIIPKVFTFSSYEDSQKFRLEYGKTLRYGLRNLNGVNFNRGTAYQTPLLNILFASEIKNYKVVFNSGRCPYFLKKGPKYIHYIHFPIEKSLEVEEHFKSIKGYIYTFPLKLIYRKLSKNIKSGVFIANSKFTANMISNIYPSLNKNKIKIVYPPCMVLQKEKSKIRDIDFVSLGSFISDKRQIDQILIAKQLKRKKFCLIGSLRSKKYYNKCRNLIKKENLQNVKIYTDAPKEMVSNILSRSKIYLHTKRNEHFGISTVEAISHGCLPIVHDSGGSREIVDIDKLRFKDINEAILKSKYFIKNYSEEKKLIEKLRNNIKKYSYEKFGLIIEQMVLTKKFNI